ncbi:ATP-dependent RNA helicase dbp9 [Coccomyxa sp. Obi]|nr:ATP-dependent RNA helicase dbp9 [Coccomyxa sp. Obi]
MSTEGPVASSSAASSFTDLGLDLKLLLALQKRQYEKPTIVQAACIPAALEGKDVVARARTGSGKTLAYLLPVLHKILAVPEGKQHFGWQALIFVPTRELCEQVREEAEAVAPKRDPKIQVSSLAVDSAAVQRDILLRIGQVVVSTPGQVAQALKEGRLRAASFQPDERTGRPGLSTLVLDEADLMLSMPGYEEDLQAIAPLIPRSCQCLLMSATSSEEVERLQKLVLHNPTTLNLLGGDSDPSGAAGPGPGSAAEIDHFYIACDRADKLLHTMVMLKLGMVRKKVLLFVNTINAGYRLKLFLEAFGIRSAVINAELPLNSRHHILQEFNKGIFDYLIATDDPAKRLEQEEGLAKPAPQPEPVPTRGRGRGKDKAEQRKRKRASENDSEFGVIRGIDFQGVKTVINVDVPESVQTYVHRVGRTGRAGQSGAAITLLTPDDSELRAELEQQLGKQPASTSGSDGAAAAQQGGLRQFERLTKASVEGLRYRAEDIARSITKSAIKEARAKELRLELLNSRRLQAHFEEHPADLALLKHDKPLAKVAAPTHLKHIPAYLKDPAAMSGRSASGNAGPGALPQKKKRKMERGKDPLKGGFVRAPKRGGDIGEPLTEMEKAAQEEGEKLARKLAKKQGKAGTFVPKRNVRKAKIFRKQ